jgi:rhamnulokinase
MTGRGGSGAVGAVGTTGAVRATGAVAAVDLGATSGRVMLARVGPNELTVTAVARFPNEPYRDDTGLHWDIEGLYRNVVAGLREASALEPQLASIGIDSWAVDYALMKGGRMLRPPFHYRDERNHPAAEAVHARVSPQELYSENGLQFLPFNTLYQLTAEPELGAADSLLLVPDLLAFWLTGREVAERTNASTTGLLDVSTGAWNDSLIERLGLPRRLFPELVDAGTVIGQAQINPGGGPQVTAVGSHDTASAVVAIPAETEDFAYISCGTWGLVGVELEAPVLSAESRAANFTNEGGVDGRTRFLHNVMGLWILTESVRSWKRDGANIDLPALLAAAAAVTTPVPIFDTDDPRFFAPADMPEAIAEWCREHGEPVPASTAEFVRSIVESLAVAFAAAVRRSSELSGKRVSVIHLVGGGSQNELLCQLTADRSGLPVLAGPVEATAIGNVLVQARSLGLVNGDLESLRSVVARTYPPRRFAPSRLSV